MVPQKTETWHKIKKTAKVTGSNVYKALGCETLKA